MPRLLVHFARFGPYHHARLRSAAGVLGALEWEVIGLETAGVDETYAWDPSAGPAGGPRVITAFPGRVYEDFTAADYRTVLFPLLDALGPDVMAIAGWGSTDAQLCLAWCRKNGVRTILMSETREADGKRVWWKEWLKRFFISRFDGALVGGKAHRDYLVKLGIAADKIRFGYNVVDNAYFAEESLKVRRSEGLKVEGLKVEGREVEGREVEGREVEGRKCPPYFLASNRFIERKNLARLIEAYASYIHSTSKIQNSKFKTWPLVLLGDGELKPSLIAQCHALGLNVIESAPWEDRGNFECRILNDECNQPAVYFPGFRQIGELPRFYAGAGCFVHPALEEPWGLVINEAMACGLPVLCGDNVGAAEELVDDGVNGWRFPADSPDELARKLSAISRLPGPQWQAMSAASGRILRERADLEAFGRGLAEIASTLHKPTVPAVAEPRPIQ